MANISLSNTYNNIVALSNTAYAGGFGSGGGGSGGGVVVDFQRNRIINGNMLLDQRNAGAVVNMTTDGVYYGPDRWKAYVSPGITSNTYQYTMQQTTVTDSNVNTAGFTKSLTMTCSSNYPFTTRYSRVGLEYTIEGYDIADFNWAASNASPASLSLWMRTNIAGTHWLSLNNNALNLSYVSTFTLSSNAWSNVKLTIPAPPYGSNWETTSNVGVILNIDMQRLQDSSSNLNTWQSVYSVTPSNQPYTLWNTAGNFIELTGVQFEKGSNSTTFESRNILKELDFAQRYYEKNFPYNIAPANNTSNGDFMYMASNVSAAPINFKTSKAVIPTVSFYNPYNATGNVTDLAGNNIVSGIQSANVTTKGFSAGVTSSTLYNKLNYFNWTADGEVNRTYPVPATVGTVQWMASISGAGTENGNAICSTTDGGVCVVGTYDATSTTLTAYNASSSKFVTTLSNGGLVDTFIAKYTSTGNVQWFTRISGTGTDTGKGICGTTDGGVCVTGYYDSGTLTAYHANNPNSSGFATFVSSGVLVCTFIAKYNSTGIVQWNTRLTNVASGSSSNYGFSICSTTDGGVCVIGYFDGASSVLTAYHASSPNLAGWATTLTNTGSNNIFIVKYTSAGSVQWITHIGGTGDDSGGRAICSTTDGGVCITAYYASTTLTAYHASSPNSAGWATTLTNGGSYDVLLAKYNSAGNVQWVARIAGSGSDIGKGICGTTDGGVCVIGYFDSTALTAYHANSPNSAGWGTILTNTSASGMPYTFVAKYTSTGSVQWITCLSGSTGTNTGYDYGQSICGTTDGGVCVTGYYGSSTLTAYHASSPNSSGFATILTNPSGNWYGFIAKYTSTGNVQWFTQMYSPTGTTWGIGICNTTDGGVCAVGYFSFGVLKAYHANNTLFGMNFTSVGVNLYDVFIVKYSAVESELTVGPVSGTTLWTQRIVGDSTGLAAFSVCSSSDGGYCVSGYYTSSIVTAYNPDGTSFGTTMGSTAGVYNGFLVKYSSTGSVQWLARQSAASGAIQIGGITALADGGFCVSGYYATTATAYNADSSAFGTTLTNSGGNDGILVKYNSSGVVQWVAHMSGTSNEYANRVASAADGSIYVNGSYSLTLTAYHANASAFGTTLANSGLVDDFIVKYNSSGTVAWIARIGSTSVEDGTGITVMVDGGVCLVCTYNGQPLTAYNAAVTSFGTVVTSPTSGSAIVKYTSAGAVAWISPIGPSATGQSVCGTTDGGVVACGWYTASPLTAYNSTLTSFTTTLANSGGNDAFIVKYNTSGVVQWVARIAGPSTANDQITSITATPDGGVCLVGYTASATLTAYNSSQAAFATTLTSKGGANDAFVAKYDTYGNVVWLTSIAGAGDDQGNGICVTSDGHIVVVGSYTSAPVSVYNKDGTAFTTTLPLSGTMNGFVTKYSAVEINTNIAPPSGNVQWVTRMSGGGNDNGTSICCAPDGSLYAFGYYDSTTLTAYNANGTSFGTTLSNDGATDLFLAKYNSIGYVQWVARLGGTVNEYAINAVVSSNGNIVINGYFTSAAMTAYSSTGSAFGTILSNQSAAGTADVYIACYSPSGVPLWIASVGGTDNEFIGALCALSDGSICAMGQFASATTTAYSANGTAFATTFNGTATDVFVVNYDSTGIVQWFTRIASSAIDNGTNMCAVGTSIYCLGFYGATLTAYKSDTTAYGTTLAGLGNNDVFLVKYQSSGTSCTVSWLARLGGTGQDNPSAICSTTDGGVCIAGTYTSSPFTAYGSDNTAFTTTLAYTAGNDVFIVKYNTSGAVQWTTRISGAGNELVNGLCSSTDGGIFVTGYGDATSTTVTFFNSNNTSFGTTLVHATSRVSYLVKYSSAGYVMWFCKLVGQSASDNSTCRIVCATPDGGACVIGYYNMASNPLSVYNANGTIFSTLVLNSSGSDTFITKVY